VIWMDTGTEVAPVSPVHQIRIAVKICAILFPLL